MPRRRLIDTARLRSRVEQTLLGQIVVRVVELNPIERGLALGSKLFTAVVPLVILLSSLVSSRDAAADKLIDGYGLTGAGAAALRSLFQVPDGQTGSAISVIGVLVLTYSLISFALALQRVYVDAWHLPSLRSKGAAWGAVWVVAFAVYFSLSTPLAHVLSAHGFRIGSLLVSLIMGSVLWIMTPFILLGRRVPLRDLLPGGIVTAVLLTLFNLGSRVYLPHSTSTNVHRYGLVGVTFTILTWLFAFSLTLIVAAACSAVLCEARARATPMSGRDAVG